MTDALKIVCMLAAAAVCFAGTAALLRELVWTPEPPSREKTARSALRAAKKVRALRPAALLSWERGRISSAHRLLSDGAEILAERQELAVASGDLDLGADLDVVREARDRVHAALVDLARTA